jgi:hypothetical protein
MACAWTWPDIIQRTQRIVEWMLDPPMGFSAAAQDGKRNSDGSFDDGLSIHFHDTGDYWWEDRRSTVPEYGQLVGQNP